MSEIEIPAESPFFEGHFPGSPILPGIVQLALVFPGAALSEIRSLKLRRTVGPGDRLEVAAADPGPDGVARFEIRRGSETVSQGVVRLGASESEPDPGVEASGGSAFPPPETLIPHAPPALLVRSVEAVSPEGISGFAVIPGDHPLAESGRAPSFLGLEAAAQAAAVLEALGRSAEAGAGPRIGYLVGIRDARLRVPYLPVDRRFRVTARLHGSAPPLSMYAVTLEGALGELLAGTISTYLYS